MTPYLEACCLHLSANVSYQNAATEVAFLTGIAVSASTQQRLVQGYEFATPSVSPESPITEVAVDGGKVRMRTPEGEESCWRDYKAVVSDQGMVANFQNNGALIDWTNQQPHSIPLTCLGDGHDGIWNIIQQIASETERREVLDWYHLNENLHKVGGSLKRLDLAQKLLWQGKVDETIALFTDLKLKQAQNFCNYLRKHQHRIVNYDYYQAEGICSIGSGMVESGIKQIDRRIQISGAQWKAENVPQVLAHRAAYINGIIS
jgi:hypothetical protein